MKMTTKIMLLLVLQYGLISVALLFFEIQMIRSLALDVTNTMRNASKSALQQTQMMDDFMAYRGTNVYRLKMPDETGALQDVDTIEAIFNFKSETEDDMKEVYNLLYDNEEFRGVAELSNNMRVPLMYYDRSLESETMGSFPELTWYDAPLNIMLGIDNTNIHPDIKVLNGGQVDGQIQSEIIDMYEFNEVYKKIVTSAGSTEEDSEYRYFFNTPLNLGVTYLNRDLLTSLFVNNVDLLMRAPHRENLGSLDTECEAQRDDVLQTQTIVCGSNYRDLIENESNVQNMNPINNGKYTFLRGDEIASSSDGKAYTGTKKVDIEYKLIDMHNSANDQILRHLFGSNTGGGSVYGSKATYLEGLNMEKYNLFDSDFSAIYNEYPFVVAKVTFYGDFIIPYTTPVTRLLSSEFGQNAFGTFLNLEDDTNVDYGAKRVSHTMLFAVTP